MDDIRQSIKTESEFLKELDRAYFSQKNPEEANTREKSLVTMLKSKEPTHDDYTEYMEKLDREFHGYLSLTNIKGLFSDALNSFKTKPI